MAKSPTTGLGDLWLLQANAKGPAVDFWRLAANATGFASPVLHRTDSSVVWADIRPYPSTDGRTLWLPYRVDGPIGEFEWSGSIMGLKTIGLPPKAGPTDYGTTNPNFTWPDIQWRARVN